MKPPSKEELLEFANKAKEGKGYLIQRHYPFHLPGKTNSRQLMFFADLELVERWKRDLNKGKDKQLRREVAAEIENTITVFRTFLDLVKGELNVKGANQQLKTAGKLGKEWSQSTGQLESHLKQAPDFRELLQTLFLAGELRSATLGKHQKAVEQALDCFTTLGVAAIDHGDDYATTMLVELTKHAVTILEALTEKRPESIRSFARKSVQWPLLARVEPEWPVQAQKKLRRILELGEDTIHGRFDQSKAYSLENVSRRYARGIVDTLEKNRCSAELFSMVEKVVKAKQEKDGIKVLFKSVPAWATDAAKLEPFSRETAENWLDVGIEMLKNECPHLPKSDDWARIANHWENRGDKQTPGRMWNSIKDALRSPIKTIARAQHPRKLAQTAQPNLGNPIPGTNKT
jgi:hypothetical protein